MNQANTGDAVGNPAEDPLPDFIDDQQLRDMMNGDDIIDLEPSLGSEDEEEQKQSEDHQQNPQIQTGGEGGDDHDQQPIHHLAIP